LYNVQLAPLVGALYSPKTTVTPFKSFSTRILLLLSTNSRSPAGYDVKFSGQVPYLPWAKVKATRYIWDGVAQPNVKGTIFGIEVQLSDSVRKR
jgi:hypothetical protein